MSLLIDALKQAEASRKQSEQERPAKNSLPQSADDMLSLEPLELERSHEEALSRRAGSRPSRENLRSKASNLEQNAQARETVKELLEVKQTHTSRTPLILASTCLLFLLAGGAYFWWATQPRGLQPGPELMTHARQPIPQLPTEVIENTAPKSEADKAPSTIPANSTTTSLPVISDIPVNTLSPARVRPENKAPEFAAKVDSPVRVRTNQNRPLAANLEKESLPSVEGTPAIQRGSPDSGNKPPALISLAYENLRNGNLAQAHSLYRQVLQQDSQNIDAINALGMIALRNGDTSIAEKYFRATLVVSPKDPTATSQLALLYSKGDPATAESRLRSLLADQPNIASAHFALGNLLSQQGRWNEAQQAYFQAFTLDNDNPDVLYNLAISLDQLKQSKLAQQYYTRAAQAAQSRPASFNAEAARTRAEAIAHFQTSSGG